MIAVLALAPALVAQPQWPSCVSCRVALNMCDADAAPPTSGRTGLNGKPLPSLIDEIAEFPMAALKPSIWTEMEEAFAQAAGTVGEVSTQGLKEWRSTAVTGEIDVAAFGELLRAKGDDLGEERVQALFSSVSRGQAKIGFEKYYQAVNDAARESRESGGGGGFSNPFAGLFGK